MTAQGQLVIGGVIASPTSAPRVMDANAWNKRGIELAEERRFEDARECFERALAMAPKYVQAYNNLGNVLSELGQNEAALAAYDSAIAIDPQYRNAVRSRSEILGKLARTEEAIAALETLLDFNPRDVATYVSMAHLLQEAALFDRAREALDMTLMLAPDLNDAKLNRALIRLTQGDLLLGFEEYEIRRKMEIWGSGDFRHAELDSVPSAIGRRVLVHREQGFGDTIQFARYAKMLAMRGADVVMYAQPVLVDLLRSLGGVTVVPEGATITGVHYETLSMSLPRLFRTRLETIPDDVPYVFANPLKVAEWRRRLEGPGLRVGVAWCGNPEHARDKARSFPLEALRPVARVPSVRLISLQRTFGLDQLGTLPPDMSVETIEGVETFDDTAAVMAALDLVISCDSAPAHLAGALGRPVWIALPTPPDWRWLHNRDDSPWYPTARLFRQQTPGDWAPVFDAMADMVGNMLLA